MKKTVNVGFLAHVDAGKTTLTEDLLFLSGETRRLGRVDDGTSATDFLDVEKRRGISIKASSVHLKYNGVNINIIDTPGHADFISEVERSLSALDLATLILSAVEGIRPQTKTLFDALVKMKIPFVVFINKVDRSGADALKVFDDVKKMCRQAGKGSVLVNIPDGSGEILENMLLPDDACAEIAEFESEIFDRYVNGEISETEILDKLNEYERSGKIIPVLTGSGKMKYGVEELLAYLSAFTPERLQRKEDELCGVVYKLDHDKTFGAIAHVRLFSGKLKSRDNVYLPRLKKQIKTTQIKEIQGGKLTDISEAEAGDLIALCGIEDVRAGDFIGSERADRIVKLSMPHFMVKAECAEEKKTELLKAIRTLDDEDPALGYEWIPEKREITVRTAGKIHLETLKEIIAERFHLSVEFSKPSVVYKETPSREGYGFEHYTMPKPCWAVVRLRIEPLPRGSGIVFESVTSDKQIHYKYQEHIRTSVCDTCVKQGLHGWEVVDAKITLIDGEDHPQHTHPLDFFVATPMAFMDGLRNTGTTLLEPYVSIEFTVEPAMGNKIVTMTGEKRGVIESISTDGVYTTLKATIPEGETFTLRDEFLSVTSGKGSYTCAFSHYAPAPDGTGQDRERIGVNPLDRSKWILHARQAL